MIKPRKEMSLAKWKNPNFDKCIVAPLERTMYSFEQKGLKIDKEAEEWIYDIVWYAYRVGCANQSRAMSESIRKNSSEIHSIIANGASEELKSMHEHFNKN